jgi:hypothetical protein
MGLLQIVRSGIKIADKATKDLQATVTFERMTGNNGSENTYANPVNLRAIVSNKQQIVRTTSGELSQSQTSILFLDIDALLSATNNNGVREQDRITPPDGDVGPILALGGFVDRETGKPVATKVYLG